MKLFLFLFSYFLSFSVIAHSGNLEKYENKKLEKPLSHYEKLDPVEFIRLPSHIRLVVRAKIHKDIDQNKEKYIKMPKQKVQGLPWLRREMVEGLQNQIEMFSHVQSSPAQSTSHVPGAPTPLIKSPEALERLHHISESKIPAQLQRPLARMTMRS